MSEELKEREVCEGWAESAAQHLCNQADQPAAIRLLTDAFMRARADRITQQDAVIAGLVEAVRQMSNQFRVYQHLHEQKKTQDGDEKALRNKEWADLGFAALAKAKESRDV